MHILLTNDDGIYAQGLWALYRHLSTEHTITVVAPDRERSAIGHAISLHQPLRVEQVDLNGCGLGFAVSGTPADCIKLALLDLMEAMPDLVVSGINPGANVGANINYSGTVAAAKEAALNGIAALSVSMRSENARLYADAARFVEKLAANILRNGLPQGTFLNVNFPDIPVDSYAGVRISRQATTTLSEQLEKRIDPRNRPYYWQGCDVQTFPDNLDYDGAALEADYISITPIKCDMTDYDTLKALKQWRIKT